MKIRNIAMYFVFLIISTLISNKVDARNLKDSIVNFLSTKKYEQMFEKAEKDKLLFGYTIKKSKDNHKKNFITGKIELIPMTIEHYSDWMRIVDCSKKESREYLKYWVGDPEHLNNDYMSSYFDNMTLSLSDERDQVDYMIKFYEFDGSPITEEEIKNKKIEFKKPKIVGHISFGKVNGELFSGYVIDKSFQNKGIATKALKLIIELNLRLRQNGFSPFKSIILEINNQNIGSMKVAQNCGFIDEGNIPEEPSFIPNSEIHRFVRKLDLDLETEKTSPELVGCTRFGTLLTTFTLGSFITNYMLRNSKKHQKTPNPNSFWHHCVKLPTSAVLPKL